MWLRVDPTIHIHFQADAHDRRGLLVESIRQQALFELFTPAIVRALMLAGDWITRVAFEARLLELGVPRERASQFVDDLLAHGLLQEAADPHEHAELDERARRYAAAGCMATATLLAAKRHQRYLDYGSAEAWAGEDALMRAYRDDDPPPEITKRHADADLLPLPSGPPLDTPQSALTIAWLSSLLRHAFGVTGFLDDPVQGRRLRKTHPSGGARHPVECYLVCSQVDGLAPGVHHYAVAEHALALLPGDPAGDPAALLDELLPGRRAPLVLVLTVTPARVMWRYREPTSFFAMMLDVGHALENFCAACRRAGLPHQPSSEVPTRALARLLDLAWLAEPPVAALAIGDVTGTEQA